MFKKVAIWFKGCWDGFLNLFRRRWTIIGRRFQEEAKRYKAFLTLADDDFNPMSSEKGYAEVEFLRRQAIALEEKTKAMNTQLGIWDKLNWFWHYLFAGAKQREVYQQAERQLALACQTWAETRNHVEQTLRHYIEINPSLYVHLYPKSTPLRDYHLASGRLDTIQHCELRDRILKIEENVEAATDMNAVLDSRYAKRYQNEHLLVEALAVQEHLDKVGDNWSDVNVEEHYKTLCRQQYASAYFPYAEYIWDNARWNPEDDQAQVKSRKRALAFYFKAIEAGSVLAMAKLGQIYYEHLRSKIHGWDMGQEPVALDQTYFHQAVAQYTAKAAYQFGNEAALDTIEKIQNVVRRIKDTHNTKYKKWHNSSQKDVFLFLGAYFEKAKAAAIDARYLGEVDYSKVAQEAFASLRKSYEASHCFKGDKWKEEKLYDINSVPNLVAKDEVSAKNRKSKRAKPEVHAEVLKPTTDTKKTKKEDKKVDKKKSAETRGVFSFFHRHASSDKLAKAPRDAKSDAAVGVQDVKEKVDAVVPVVVAANP